MKEIVITNKATINAEGKLHSNHCKAVVAIKADGSEIKFFSSIQDAAEQLCINANYISTCMNNEKTCKGWDFYPAKETLSVVDRMMNIFNRNAMEAQKWRAQEAEKERIRLEEEQRQNNILKLKQKLTKLDTDITKCSDKYRTLVDAYNTTKEELAMLENGDDECGC